ncbi:uncharacterized protein BX663DRAFT_507938 [Cokeromyces recurvatus]|uniref:uncharacterized protein n=1 Tax=Cokeromyces recurvatus TaxID=90255 RepID=UPI0022203FAA|nr:uncharacterized protein BX663DRAFT_507938 [Cokeromyces recurvatus]KAI7903233.1 hypothetical protein BX663DRAFT_507938 [Cokeromyces recurvatus]
MSISKSLIQFENNESYIKNLLDLIINSLEQSSQDMKTEEILELGEGMEIVTRPWALVFLKDDKLLQTELLKRINQEGYLSEERKWLDLIQVCRIDTIHQIRAVLCALHMNMEEIKYQQQKTSILDWMRYEKDNQPPSLIIVVDLLDLLVHEDKLQNNTILRYMTIK